MECDSTRIPIQTGGSLYEIPQLSFFNPVISTPYNYFEQSHSHSFHPGLSMPNYLDVGPNPHIGRWIARTTGSQNQQGSEDTKKRAKTIITAYQWNVLEKYFEKRKYPEFRDRERLHWMTGLSNDRIRIWFQNRRAKCRRGKLRRWTVTNNPGNGFNGETLKQPSETIADGHGDAVDLRKSIQGRSDTVIAFVSTSTTLK